MSVCLWNMFQELNKWRLKRNLFSRKKNRLNASHNQFISIIVTIFVEQRYADILIFFVSLLIRCVRFCSKQKSICCHQYHQPNKWTNPDTMSTKIQQVQVNWTSFCACANQDGWFSLLRIIIAQHRIWQSKQSTQAEVGTL